MLLLLSCTKETSKESDEGLGLSSGEKNIDSVQQSTRSSRRQKKEPKALEDFDVKPDKIKSCQIAIEKKKQVCAVFQKIFELSGTDTAVKPYAFGDLTVEKVCNANDRTGGRACTLAK